ncbi:MAG TPA: TIGR02221 family CRISPR-associated protein, partial [Clostridiales bacterium]|nr:TIGR02221 family CRISPR-associated protein [Clostridiales bacterium]
MLKFFSLLGNGRYIPCNYYWEDKKVHNCCYIQQALIEILEQKGVTPDKIVVFTTEYAYKTNWLTNKYDSERPGLRDELKNISKRTNIKVCTKHIPDGQNEDELWKLFEIILDELEEGDEIILDITHSFRYLPMLTFIVINYARIVKNCKLNAIYYGAFEILGNYQDVKNMSLEDRNAPIFDLTPFVQLFDWTIGVDRYLATGDASIIYELTQSEVKKINTEISRDISKSGKTEDRAILFRDPNTLKKLAESMREFNEVILTCRGQEITNAASILKTNVDKVAESTAHGKIKPLAPIIGMLKDRFDRFSHNDDSVNIIEAAKWCLDNGMYQQGFTILQEGLISYACDKCNIDKIKENERNNINAYAYMVSKGDIDADCLAVDMEKPKANEFFKLIHDMAQLRNDINHAGWREGPSAPQKFESKLEMFINKAESILVESVSYNKNIVYDNLLDRQMLLIFSHELTDIQRKEAKERFGISKFVALDDALLDKWADVPPHLENLSDYLADIIEWIDKNGQPGDYAL